MTWGILCGSCWRCRLKYWPAEWRQIKRTRGRRAFTQISKHIGSC